MNGAGAGGGTAIKWIEAASLGATESVTVGEGGSARTGASMLAGEAGGPSSFGTHCSATGGAGGPLMDNTVRTPATGGAGTGGTLNFTGERGEVVLGDNTEPQLTCKGGNSLFGEGGARTLVPSHGQAGTGYGSGGASGNSSSSTDYNSGAGANGLVIVEEFF
jgi:hypothetical protein